MEEWELTVWKKVYDIVQECWTPEINFAVNMMGTMIPVDSPFQATYFSLHGALLKVLTSDNGCIQIGLYFRLYDYEWMEWSKTATHKEVLKSVKKRIECVNYQLN